MQVQQYRDADGYLRPVVSDEVYRNHRVYFVQAGEDGPVKVGWSTNVAARLKQLQTSSPVELKVIHTMIGSSDLEAEIQRRLKARGFHLRGEWFRITRDQVLWIADDLFVDGLVAQ